MRERVVSAVVSDMDGTLLDPLPVVIDEAVELPLARVPLQETT